MAGLDLENRPWWWAAIAGVILAVAMGFAFENYVFSDMQKDIVKAQGDLEVLKKKVQEGKMAEARLPQFREEAERLEVELSRLLRILPTARQTDEIIKKLKSLTERGLFRLVTFQPMPQVPKEFISEWPISVVLQGQYHDLAQFFDRLSKFSRIINVDELKIAALQQKKSGFTINSSFTMKTFIYIDKKAQ